MLLARVAPGASGLSAFAVVARRCAGAPILTGGAAGPYDFPGRSPFFGPFKEIDGYEEADDSCEKDQLPEVRFGVCGSVASQWVRAVGESIGDLSLPV